MAIAAIPRFLLPQRSVIWRSNFLSTSRAAKSLRNVSQRATPKKPKQMVLEKPAKFNPPSHGARLRRDPPKYPGPWLSQEQIAAQKTKNYPNMMPAEGTFMNWFLTSRSIHIYITLGTLFSLAGYTTITHFKRTSKFADMLPPASDLFFHPVAFVRTCVEVLRLHTAHVSAETAKRRKRIVEDVRKRGQYRKAHGLEHEGFGGWTAKTDAEDLGPAIPTGDVEGITAIVGVENAEDIEDQVPQRKKHVKKWLGIW